MMSEVSMIWSDEIDYLLKNGHDLMSIGVKNFALNKIDSIEAINGLAKIGVPILGGDVYYFIDGEISCGFENWYCDRLDSETDGEYLDRSIMESIKFINDFSIKNVEPLFAIVPKV